MSGGRYSESREKVLYSTSLESDDRKTREEAKKSYNARIKSARKEAPHKKAERTYNPQEDYDTSKVKLKINEPPANVKEVNVCLIDNSGSNKLIAQKMRDSSPHITSILEAINPDAATCFIYFSDHCDDSLFRQEIDYIIPNQIGSQVLASSALSIKPAHGGDEPEAYECALKIATTEIPLGNAVQKNLFIIGDQIAHDMIQDRSDNGCPYGVDWKQYARKAYEVYNTFQVIGCGDKPDIMNAQQQFLRNDRVAFDHVDLSSIEERDHRLMMTPNVLLFLIARNYDKANNTGLKKTRIFLRMLYGSWLDNPIFGKDTDSRAKEMITRLTRYLEYPQSEINAMLKDIFVE